MCIIVDANVAHEFSPLSVDARPVWDWIQNNGGRIVTGGRNKDELYRNLAIRRLLVSLKQAGRIVEVADGTVIGIERTDELRIRCQSDDPHVIALARASGARLVYTRDRNLHSDIGDRRLLEPRGSVYQTRRHAHLLRSANCQGP